MQPREAGAGSWVTAESTARTEVCMLLPNAQAGKTPLGFLGIWPWIPQFPQRHFYLWMDARLLLWRDKMKDILFSHVADVKCLILVCLMH